MSTIDSEADLFAMFKDNAEAEDVTMHSSCDTDIIDSRTDQITQHQHEVFIARKQQAERMVKRSQDDLQAGAIGHNVAVPIPQLIEGKVLLETF